MINNEKKLTKADILEIPNSIIIDGYQMKFKNTLANDNLSYRCIHRTCKTLLTISKEDVRKISIKEEINKIKYSINKEHTCTNTTINKEINSNDCLTDTELYAKAKQLIDLNLDKSLNCHMQNLNENSINIKRKTIEYILYKDRDEQYPSNDEILKFID